jgi:hypothetical protein
MDGNELLLKKIVIGLDTLDAAYHFVLPDGQEFKSEKPLVVEEKKRTRVVDPNRVKNGAYFKERLSDMAVGECRFIPMQPEDDIKRFHGNLSAWCFHNWAVQGGKGEGEYFSTERNDEEHTVTVYRFK